MQGKEEAGKRKWKGEQIWERERSRGVGRGTDEKRGERYGTEKKSDKGMRKTKKWEKESKKEHWTRNGEEE